MKHNLRTIPRCQLPVALFGILLPLLAGAMIDSVWVRRWYGPPNTPPAKRNDCIGAMAVDNQGFIYTTGPAYDSSIGYYGLVTTKFDSSGNVVWRCTTHEAIKDPSAVDSSARTLVLSDSNDVYVISTAWAGPTEVEDILVASYSGATGAQRWLRKWHPPNQAASIRDDGVSGIAYDPTNRALYVCGYSLMSDGAQGYDYVIMRINPSTGDTVWLRTWDWPNSYHGNDFASAICIGASGDPVVTGSSFNSNIGKWYWQTLRFNRTTGDTVAGWTTNGRRYWDPDDDEEPYGIFSDASGNVYVTGYRYREGMMQNTFMTVKHAAGNGFPQWQVYDGTGDDDSYAFGGIARGNYAYVYGTVCDPLEATSYDWAVHAYNATTGSDIWPGGGRYFDGGLGNDEEPCAIALDNQGRPYVLGYAEDTVVVPGRPDTVYNFLFSQWAIQRYDSVSGNVTLELRYYPPRCSVNNEPWALCVIDSNHIYAGGATARWDTIPPASWNQDQTLVRFGPVLTKLDSLSLPAAIDSGTFTVPKVFVRALGYAPVVPRITLRIGSIYQDTMTSPRALVPRNPLLDTITLSLDTFWALFPRGSYAVKCSSSYSSGGIPDSSIITRTLLIRVRDVGPVAFVSFPDTIDEGTALSPQVRMQNFGSVTETFNATCVVGALSDTAVVTNLAAGDTVTATFVPSLSPTRGFYPSVSAYTRLPSDINRANDTLRYANGLFVRYRDVACSTIVRPVGVYEVGDT
ncbi:MAG: hypothetical protein ABIK62_05080, partial [candidate division WOR-3 bacterium]